MESRHQNRNADPRPLEAGEKVQWRYIHKFNLAQVVRVKQGTFVKLVHHPKKYTGEQMALVKFDGNKNASSVDLMDVTRIG